MILQSAPIAWVAQAIQLRDTKAVDKKSTAAVLHFVYSRRQNYNLPQKAHREQKFISFGLSRFCR